MIYKLTTAATSLPITLEEAKTQLNIDASFTDDDIYIISCINAAAAIVEGILQGPLCEQEWELQLSSLSSTITLHKNPVNSVVVKYYDENNSDMTLSSSSYQLTSGFPAQIIINDDVSLSLYDRVDAVRVEIACGYAEVPEDIKMWVKVLVTIFYESRDFSIKPETLLLIRSNLMTRSLWL